MVVSELQNPAVSVMSSAVGTGDEGPGTHAIDTNSELHSLSKVQFNKHCISSRGGECTSLLGPGEPYTPNSEEGTNCLGPVEPYAPSTHISELIVLAHIGKKVRAPGTAHHPRRPNSPGTRRVRKAALLQ